MNMHRLLGMATLLALTLIASATGAYAQAGLVDVVEYYNADLDHFFITATPAEQAAVDAGAAGAWHRTGNTFATGGPDQVCRFYGSVSPGPNSHFYTVIEAECADLKRIQAITPPSVQRWNFESNDFDITPSEIPSSGSASAPAGSRSASSTSRKR